MEDFDLWQKSMIEKINVKCDCFDSFGYVIRAEWVEIGDVNTMIIQVKFPIYNTVSSFDIDTFEEIFKEVEAD